MQLISCITAVNNGFDVFCGKIKGRKDFVMHGIITTNRKLLLQRYIRSYNKKVINCIS